MPETIPPPTEDPPKLFAEALEQFDRRNPVLVMGHNDADGLSATAIFVRALENAGWTAETRTLGRGENPWSEEIAAELGDGTRWGGLIVTDLGLREGDIGPGAQKLPTVIVDHHVPQGFPEKAVIVTGYGLDPIPTSSVLAWACAAALGDNADLVWLAAVGLIGDMADKDFPGVMAEAKPFGVTALRGAVSLLNAPRRSASGDSSAALALLTKADGPKDILSGRWPETQVLIAAKEEVKAALDAARRVPPKVVGDVALIRFSSPCQIHPLVAQSWRGRLAEKIVIAANSGYRPGWVHFAARTATGKNLIEFLAEKKPPGAGPEYGSGHAQATGGALRPEDWHTFLAALGFAGGTGAKGKAA